MFGFPETVQEFELKHYIRLCVIICGYLLLRPALDKMFAYLGERDRKRQAKKEQEEQARMHKELRIKEKLGISPLDEIPDAEKEKSAAASSTATESAATKPLRRKQKPQDKKLQKVYDDMISDEDIEDLITRADSSKEEEAA